MPWAGGAKSLGLPLLENDAEGTFLRPQNEILFLVIHET